MLTLKEKIENELIFIDNEPLKTLLVNNIMSFFEELYYFNKSDSYNIIKEWYGSHAARIMINEEDMRIGLVPNELVPKIKVSVISFKDRTKGIATLIRSPHPFKGIDKNKFMVKSKDLNSIFADTDISYKVIKETGMSKGDWIE